MVWITRLASISSRILSNSPPLKRFSLRHAATIASALQQQKKTRVIYGDLNKLPNKVRHYVEENARLCRPDSVHICDGTEQENSLLMYMLQKDGILKNLLKYENCWSARTDPADVARVESKTYISTEKKRETIPETKDGIKSQLGNWMHPDEMETELSARFPECMSGKTHLLSISNSNCVSPAHEFYI